MRPDSLISAIRPTSPFEFMETDSSRQSIVPAIFGASSGKWKTWVRIGAGIICLLAIFSRHSLDPSPYNLFKSYDDIHNWLGFPGALIGGFLVDHWGTAAYVLPMLWMFTVYRRHLGLGWGLLLDGLTVMLAAAAVGLILAAVNRPLLQYTGLVGYLAGHHLSQFPGSLLCWSIIIGFAVRHWHDYRLNPQVPLQIRSVLVVTVAISIDAMRFLAAQASLLIRTILTELTGLVRPIVKEWRIRFDERIRRALLKPKNNAFAAPINEIATKPPATRRRLLAIGECLPKWGLRNRWTTRPSVSTIASDSAEILHHLLRKYENDLLARSLNSPIMRPETTHRED
jgi:hypothetical protein